MSDFFSSPAIAERAVQAFFERNKYNTTLQHKPRAEIIYTILKEDKEGLVSFVDSGVILIALSEYISTYNPFDKISARVW